VSYDRDDLLIYLVSPDRSERWPVTTWAGFSFEHKGQPIGPGSVTLPASASCIPSGAWATATEGQEFLDYGIDCYWRGNAADNLLWSGVVMKPAGVHRGSAASAYITLNAETWASHFLRRRLHLSTTHDAQGDTGYAENLVLLYISRAIAGVTWTIGSYPAGVARSDFGTAGWTVQTASAHGAPTSSSITYKQQSSNNLRGIVEDLCENYDLALTCVENPAGTWTFDTAHAYQKTDLTATVRFAARKGNMIGESASIDRYGLANVARLQGSGTGSSQVASWTSDGTSITAYGVYENAATSQGADSTACTTDVSGIIQADPVRAYGTPIHETSGHVFMSDFFRRDLVAFEDDVYGRSAVTKVIRGYKLTGSQGGKLSLALMFGDLQHDGLAYMTQRTGFEGGFGTGSKWRGNDG